MARQRETVTPFSLSFLDIMSCGFGAVVLLFLIIKHNVDASQTAPQPQADLRAEVSLLEEDIRDGQRNLVRIRNTIDEVDEERSTAEGLALRITRDIDRLEALVEQLEDKISPDNLEALKTRIRELERQKQQIEAQQRQSGENVRRFAGDGQRAYVTGLRLDGQRILILLDASSSMLDDSVVNVLRRRNMRDERKRTAPKWLRAVSTVDWLTAKFPLGSRYQIYLFNTDVKPLLADTAGTWLDVRDRIQLNQAMATLKQVVPDGGTNLDRAVAAVNRLSPRPDNIYLVTDSLPTQGARPPVHTTVTGRERLKLFDAAVEKLPDGVPVNVVLLPMEGDPLAAYAFWHLAQTTRGSYISPSEDWP